MRNRSVIALALMLLTVACGGQKASFATGTTSAVTTTARVDTTTIQTTTTTLAPLIVGPVADWEGQHVSSVCLQVAQSYPQVPGYEYDLATVLGELLAPSGVAVLMPGAACDAVLDVQMSLEGRPAEYEGIGTVYSGMLRRFDMTLSAAGRDPLTFDHLTDTLPGELASSTDPATPEAFLEHHADVWATIAMEGLVQFWGPAAAIEALRIDADLGDAYYRLCRFAEFPLGECLPPDYAAWRDWFEQGG